MELAPAFILFLVMLIRHRKTQVALAYVYWLQETWQEISVFWIHASNAERFRQAFTSIAEECQIPGYDDPKIDVLPLVRRWLENKDRGQWLMVLDNADNAQLFFPPPQEPPKMGSVNQEDDLGQYIPECPHGSILVTTRNKQAGLKLAKGNPPIEIGAMAENDSEQLLRVNLGREDIASSELLALSSRLDHLPLALAQAAAFIEANTIAVDEYLQCLNKSDQNLVDLLSEEFETVGRDSETPRAVAETWILSFEQIRQQNAFASELLSLMSLFDRQAIPLEFLPSHGVQQQGQGPRGEVHRKKALGVLKAFSFITEDKDHSLNMHRLVQLVTQKWLVKRGTIHRVAGQALSAVSQAYPYGNFDNRITCSSYLPHAHAVLKLEGVDLKVERASLLRNIAAYLNFQGQWKDAEKFQLEVVELRKEILGIDHPDTLTSMGNLASTFWNQGRWEEAEELEIQVLETSKTKLGIDHPDTLISMGNLASTFRNQGRWEEAEELEIQVLETRKTKLGIDHPDTLTSMANLA